MTAESSTNLFLKDVLKAAKQTCSISMFGESNKTPHLEDVTTLEELQVLWKGIPSMFRRCGNKNYFSCNEPILPELVREFWKNAQAEADCIRSAVSGKEIVVNVDTISEAINCFRFNDWFQEARDEVYTFGKKVERTLYGENFWK